MSFYCKICEKSFDSEEALKMHNDAKHFVKVKKPLISQKGKMKIRYLLITIITIIAIGLIAAGIFFLANKKVLPPTTIEGHIEANPSSHVLKGPMPLAIQKHMLEHADGSGPPGVVINYNCIDFECEPDLIQRLEEFSKKYPTFVYVAPFKNMKAKIAVTRTGEIITMEDYDEAVIDNFIKRG